MNRCKSSGTPNNRPFPGFFRINQNSPTRSDEILEEKPELPQIAWSFAVSSLFTETTTSNLDSDQCIRISGVDWNGYTSMLRLRGDRPTPRILYLDGNLILVSPAYSHEFDQNRLGRFVEIMAMELGIPCTAAGSTTLRRRRKNGGVEGNETYYLTHEPQIRGKREISLQHDPPPDLAIEVVHTHPADDAIEVYRRLGVPEVWVWATPTLRILALDANKQYQSVESSVAFPFLAASEVSDWISRPINGPESSWSRDFHRWVQDMLTPRFRDSQSTPPQQ